jgi:hypothetical protein
MKNPIHCPYVMAKENYSKKNFKPRLNQDYF